MNTQTFKRIASVVCLVCGLASTSVFAGTIVGSAHDFAGDAWNLGNNELCVVCHAPHNNAGGVIADAPLWNHDIDLTAVYTPYAGFDMQSNPGAPTGASLLCLSCHDGTVALDAFGGAAPIPGTLIGSINPNLDVGKDLSDDHPISINYAAAGPELNPDTTGFTYADGTAGTIVDLLDAAGTVQCSSCHDVHNTKTNGVLGNKLLVIDNSALSALCTTCHIK